MTYLPDVNVWVALSVNQHTHNAAARRWLEEAADGTLAFCRVTQMGFLRLMTNSRALAGDALSTEDAWRLADRLRRDDSVIFATEPLGIDSAWREATKAHKSGSNFWTDAYLAAFAELSGYTLVTFDRGFRNHRTVPVRILSD